MRFTRTILEINRRFDSLQNWLLYIPSSEVIEDGRVHHLANSDRDAIVERLLAFNNKERYYTFSIMKVPFLVTMATHTYY